ncbi:ABC transporter ATP-binding protein [Lactobacillus bombicola]|uniref:ABC transporter ATP-binding protein n=1 Tax=Lactobacillus bombicola TaxID=1505723 RepID=UPI000E57DFE9|nr:ABC transporter ATP-binding protein [Lactobacillus bombicola]RHW53250.1 hypothetical protein DS833_00340 [Lactobacillus bombicola]
MNQIRKTFKLISNQQKLLLMSLIIINIFIGLLPIFSVYLVQNIINILTTGKKIHILLILFAIYILLSIIENFLSSLQNYINGKISNYLSFSLEKKVLDAIDNIDLKDFENEETYSEIDKVSNEAPEKPFEVFNSLNNIFISLITMISGIVYLFKINIYYSLSLFLLTLISIPILLSLSNRQFLIHWKRAEKERKAWYIKYIMTHDFGVKEIKFFNVGKYLKEKFIKLKKEFINQDLKLLKSLSIFNFLYEFFVVLITGGIVLSVAESIYFGRALIGTLTSVTQIISLTRENTSSIINELYDLKYDLSLLERLFVFLEKNNPNNFVVIENEKKELKRVNEIRAINLKYGNNKNRLILKNINFSIKKGMLVAIVGKNGSGKTTLVKLLSGLYEPYEKKSLLINNVDITDYKKGSLHKKISVLFQDFVKYEFTLQENIGIGDIDEINNTEKMKEILTKYAKSLNKNIQLSQQLGTWFSSSQQISGGQWQGVATSRAMFNQKSDVVILDEPNSALDPIAEQKLFLQFREFVTKDKIGIFVSHKIAAVKNSDLILVLNNGSIVACGTHKQLMKSSKEYRELEKAEKYE